MNQPSRLAALRRSRGAQAGAAALVLALVGGGVALAHPWKDGSSRATLTQSPVDLPTDEPSAAASATPSATASASAAATSSPSSSATAAGDDDGDGGGGGDGLGPHPAGSVTVPHTDGQHTWSGTSNGTTIRASISPEHPHAGSPVTFTFHVSGPESGHPVRG